MDPQEMLDARLPDSYYDDEEWTCVNCGTVNTGASCSGCPFRWDDEGPLPEQVQVDSDFVPRGYDVYGGE